MERCGFRPLELLWLPAGVVLRATARFLPEAPAEPGKWVSETAAEARSRRWPSRPRAGGRLRLHEIEHDKRGALRLDRQECSLAGGGPGAGAIMASALHYIASSNGQRLGLSMARTPG